MVLSGFETTCFRIWDIEILRFGFRGCTTLCNVAQLNCLNADVTARTSLSYLIDLYAWSLSVTMGPSGSPDAVIGRFR